MGGPYNQVPSIYTGGGRGTPPFPSIYTGGGRGTPPFPSI